jgi:MFS family permease
MNPVWKNKNLCLYFSGQVVSLIGTWMQQMALSWLIYRLTNSPFMLGLIGFAGQAPSLLVTPFAGIVADRTNRHRLLITTQALAMVQAALLATLVLTGHTQLWQLVALSAVLGIITAFDMPTRQTFLVDMLDNKTQLAGAIGISSSINTATRLVGPFVAGLFVSWAGEGICFLANAVSYIAVIVALLFVKSNQRPSTASKSNALSQMKEGFVYTIGFAPIRDLICMIALIGFFAMPFAVLMPAFARDVFHGNASTLGFLSGASGAGTVVGAVFLASRKGTRALSRWIVIGCAISGLALIGFGLSSNLALSLFVVSIVGFGSMLAMAGSITVIQTIVDEDKRGRVMSFVMMAFMGLSPFGGMAAGALANVIGVGATVMATGILTVAISLVFCRRISRIHLQATPVAVNEGISEADQEMAAMHS